MTRESRAQAADQQQIGERLRTLRLQKGWTAREAALAASREAPEELNISTGRWQNWECDQRKPSLNLLPILARALDTTPEYLAGWRDAVTHNITEKSSTKTTDRDALDTLGLSDESLSMLKVSDDAMAPDFTRGDLVLVDASRNQVMSAGVYALTSGGAPLIRFVRRELGQGVTVYGNDEKHAPPQHFSDEAFSALEVIGEVVFTGRWLIER
ncbi:XRE family transcriptional regulator [Veronia pacifica]|uniref:HTH cro/C1-type domain-containing protein n=1 Tax=Veronia pacifica TaxID=1080227 RepID=A0A1C3EAH7_9GAMM|nr:XRE family transcriptional regulator [Veronia pacifica]ODA30219.1 hypothetical protein A8L45_20655 [Veronia pacifica]